MLVREFLERTADRHPDSSALVRGEHRWSFADLERDANRLAHGLRAAGVGRGDRVAVHLPNLPETVIADFAAVKAGAVFVNLGRGLREAKLAAILDDCGAAALISETRVAGGGSLEGVTRLAPDLRLVVPLQTEKIPAGAAGPRWRGLDDILDTEPDERPDVVNIDRDLACLIYTSGSTGNPKGIMADHDAVSFASGSIIRYLELSGDDVLLSALPLSFDYGLYQPLMGCRVGAPTVLADSFAFPGQILTTIVERGVTGLPLVPSALALLLQMELERFELDSLRFVTNTGAALPVTQIRELRRRLPWVRIYSMYGLSETKRTLYLPPEEIDDHPDSVGRPIPGTEAWLEDGSGRRVGPGEVGELVVRGRHVMRGYWNNPEATERRFAPGPLPGERVCRSGDLFRQDEGGRFYFVARTDEVIKSRGEKVAPAEVERALHEHPLVAEACVVPIPDPVQGAAIKAFVVAREPSLDERQLIAHCRRHLEEHMQPRRFELVTELPRTSAGKVDRQTLRQRAEEASSEAPSAPPETEAGARRRGRATGSA
jgi:amino acid adenylation domain-containing protein